MPDTPDRDAIRRRHAAITAWPWRWVNEDGSCWDLWGPDYGGVDMVLSARICNACRELGRRCTAPSDADAEFIAHAPADIAALLAYTERLEKALGDIQREMPQECVCHAAYHSRQLRDPDCGYHDYGEYVIGLIDAALARREGDA